MRIALISDIHANEVAFEAVIKDIEQAAADQIVCLGDIATLGPLPCAVVQILRDLNCTCILGNHDAFLLDPELIHTYTEAPIIVEAVAWCRSQLSGEDLDFIRTFQPYIEFDLNKEYRLLYYHGSPRNHMEYILSTTPSDRLDQILGSTTATVMIGGHTHIQMLRQHKGNLIVNPGSVGLPFKEFVFNRQPEILEHSEYAIIDIEKKNVNVLFRRVSFSQKAFRKTIENCQGPIRHLFP